MEYNLEYPGQVKCYSTYAVHIQCIYALCNAVPHTLQCILHDSRALKLDAEVVLVVLTSGRGPDLRGQI